MRWFWNLSIRAKLNVLFLLTGGIALLMATTLIVIYDSVTFTRTKVRDLYTQADILGKTSTAALTFNDAGTATEYLAALKVKSTIRAAALYGTDGKPFATYSRDIGRYAFPAMETPGHRIVDGDIELFHRIVQGNNVIGIVYLRDNLQRVDRLVGYMSIILLLMIVALGISLWIASRLQRLISGPILEVADVSKAVIEKKDYTLRVARYGGDEIGSLAEAFNQLLMHIQERDRMLVSINQSLIAEIKERKHAQGVLKRNMDELARSNSELEQFAYVSSHDLQEPLRMVASYTQLLEKRYHEKFDEKGLLYLHYIVDGAKRMQQLIDDLLTFSRVGTRSKALHPVSSQDACNAALANLRAAIAESGAQVSCAELPNVLADVSQLTQVFQNLIGNAIKYRGPHAPVIRIDVTRQNDVWQFSVKDNGIGIDSEHFDRIFMIFQRLHSRTDYPGSGIGLAICKKIVDRHGGRIWVESETGHGTTFFFTLRSTHEAAASIEKRGDSFDRG